MGCNSSVPDPNMMYGKNKDQIQNGRPSTGSKNKIHPGQNGSAKIGIVINGKKSGDNFTSISEKDRKDSDNRQLKGDRLVYSNAKYSREKTIRAQMEKREKLAQEMCAKAMDERERFSLSTTRSRTTSRAASPKTNHRDPAQGHGSLSVTSSGNVAVDIHATVEEPIPGPSNIQSPDTKTAGSSHPNTDHVESVNFEKPRREILENDKRQEPKKQAHQGTSSSTNQDGGQRSRASAKEPSSKHHTNNNDLTNNNQGKNAIHIEPTKDGGKRRKNRKFKQPKG